MTRDLHPGPDLDDAGRLVREALDAVEVPPYPGAVAGPPAPVHLAARRARRPGPLAVAAAVALVLGLGATAVTLASSGDDVRTDGGRPAATTSTTTERSPATTTTTAPTTTTPSTAPTTTATTATPDATGTPGGGSGAATTGTTAAGEGAAAELTGVAEAASANGPVHLRGAMTADTPTLADDRVALRLSAEPWLPEVDWRHDDGAVALSRRWMVSAVYNQYVVWGVVGSDITRVVVYLDDGTSVSATPAPIGSPSSGWSGFVAVLPQLQTIGGVAGERADGSVSVNATDLDANLAPLEPIARSTGEHIAYLPVVGH